MDSQLWCYKQLNFCILVEDIGELVTHRILPSMFSLRYQ